MFPGRITARNTATGTRISDTVTVTAEGADEEAAVAALKEFFENNL